MLHYKEIHDFLTVPILAIRAWGGLALHTFVGWSLAAYLLLQARGLRSRIAGPARLCGIAAAIVCLGMLLISTFSYARAPGLMDHAEVSVVSISALWGQGKPLYRDLDAAERYSVGYGPVVYLLDSAALSLFGNRIRVAKNLGALLLLGSFLAMGVCARRLGCSPTRTILVLGYVAAGISWLELASLTMPIASWARPDPQILFCASFCALCSTFRRPLLAAAGVGIALGISVNLKLHGPVYLAPMLLPLYWRAGARGLLGCLAIAAVTALTPFAIPGISLPNYLRLLSGAVGNHPFSTDLFCSAAISCVYLLAPVFVMLYVNLRSAPGAELQTRLGSQVPLVTAVVLATLIILVPASKVGNLPYHLLPLIPGYALVLSWLLPCPRIELQEAGRTIRGALSCAAAFTVIGVSTSIIAGYLIWGWCLFNPLLANPGLDEIKEVCRRYPGQTKAMGYGTDESYPWTFCRPALVFRGQPCLVDATEMMEFRATDLPTPQATIDALRYGFVGLWMIPKGGEPFSMHSRYPPNDLLFDQRFCAAFRDNYELRDHTAHYDLWVHRTVALPIALRAR